MSDPAFSDPSSPRQQFGDYRIVRFLARGGMGAVYEAEHTELGTRVALKVIDRIFADDSAARLRFSREARTLSQLQHPNVVRVFDMAFEGPRPFLVMELLEGETLRARLEREKRLSLSEAVELFAPISAAVAAIHDAGVLHRDLKLGNVMLARRPDGIEPVVLDFGISKAVGEVLDDALTRSEGILGTPRYLSPEQTLNPKAASPRSDQYALGVMLYECITGLRPFTGASSYELMHAILNAPVCPPSELVAELPSGIDAVVSSAMSRDPARRFDDVRSFGAALLPFGSDSLREHYRGVLFTSGANSWADDVTEVEKRERSSPARTPAAAPPRGNWRALLAVPAAALALGVGYGWARHHDSGVASSPASSVSDEQPRTQRLEASAGQLARPSAPVGSSLPPANANADAAASPSQRNIRSHVTPPAKATAIPSGATKRARPTKAPARSMTPAIDETKAAANPPKPLGKDDAIDPFAAQ